MAPRISFRESPATKSMAAAMTNITRATPVSFWSSTSPGPRAAWISTGPSTRGLFSSSRTWARCQAKARIKANFQISLGWMVVKPRFSQLRLSEPWRVSPKKAVQTISAMVAGA